MSGGSLEQEFREEQTALAPCRNNGRDHEGGREREEGESGKAALRQMWSSIDGKNKRKTEVPNETEFRWPVR